MRRLPLLLGILSLTALATQNGASAAILNVNVTGNVDFVDASLAPTFNTTQTLNLNYAFDTTVVARAGSSSNFAAFDALTSLSVTVGGYSASSNAAPEIQVDNDPGGGNHDRYAVLSRASEGLTGADVNGIGLAAFGFRLDDSTDSVFNDALVLPTAIDLNDFDNRQFFLFFGDLNNPTLVFGTVTSVSVQNSSIPEPGTAVIWGLGVLGMSLFARRRRRRAGDQNTGAL